MKLLYNALVSLFILLPFHVTASEDTPDTTFYFVRHGITPWSMEDVKKGPQNLSISDKGRADIEVLTSLFEKIDRGSAEFPTGIFHSPLIRCIETMEILQGKLRTSAVRQIEDLQEVYRGDWSKLEETTITQAVGLLWNKKYAELEGIIPDTEKWDAFNQRVLKAIEACLQENKKYSILVTHGQVVKSFLKQKECWTEDLASKWTGPTRPPIKVIYDGKTWLAQLME